MKHSKIEFDDSLTGVFCRIEEIVENGKCVGAEVSSCDGDAATFERKVFGADDYESAWKLFKEKLERAVEKVEEYDEL